jgi:methylenetetrahydrofolate reductase (NADPH)
VSVAKRLRLAGMNPVPHIAARQLANPDVAADFLSRLRDEADARRALIIAGDSDTQAGAYDSSIALLESGLLQAHGIRSIGIAGYPEGHPKIAEAALTAALDRKIDYAAAHGLDLFAVTQFCFDGQAILDWLGRLRARGAYARPRGRGGPGDDTRRSTMVFVAASAFDPRWGRAISLTRCLAARSESRAPAAPQAELAWRPLVPVRRLCESARWIDNVAAGRFRLSADESFNFKPITTPTGGDNPWLALPHSARTRGSFPPEGAGCAVSKGAISKTDCAG